MLNEQFTLLSLSLKVLKKVLIKHFELMGLNASTITSVTFTMETLSSTLKKVLKVHKH